MAIQYRIQLTPTPKGSKKQQRAHIRPVTTGITGTYQVCEQISYKCTLTNPDIVAVLTALSEVLQSELAQNHSVHLDGLGTFSLSLKGEVVKDESRKRLQVKDSSIPSVIWWIRSAASPSPKAFTSRINPLTMPLCKKN